MAKIDGSVQQNNNQSIKSQNFIKDFRQKYPEESKKLSDAQILTIFDKKVDYVVLKEGLCRIFNIDLSSGKKNIGDYYAYNNPERSMAISTTGRYDIYDHNRDEHSYYAADGTKLKESYYRNAEEEDRMNRQVRKAENNNSIYVQLTDYRSYELASGIEDYFKGIEYKINKAEKRNGLFASLWSGIKNKTGWGDSSSKAREQLKKERELIKEKGYIEGFTAITGLRATPKNIEDFKNGKIKLKSEKMLEAYKEGQKMAADIEGDLISGAAAFGLYSTVVISAPFTAGVSIIAGAAAAAAAGAAVKPAVKALASFFGNYAYTDLDNFKKDAATGAFSGVLAPISAGMGGAVGKTIANRLGVEAVIHIGKKGVEQTAKAGMKEIVKTGLLNPAGYKYTANSFIRRETALASELITDGVTAGTVDGGFRAGVESDWDTKEMGKGALIGGAGGFVLSPAIGRTLRTTGKFGHKLGLSDEELLKHALPEIHKKGTPAQKKIIEEILNNETLLKSDIISFYYQDILNPNLGGDISIVGKLGHFIFRDDSDYYGKTAVEEILTSRLKVLKQLKESPDLIDDEICRRLIKEALAYNDGATVRRVQFLGDCNIKEVAARTEVLKKQMLEHPQMYVSGEYTDNVARERISEFFSDNPELLKVVSAFDNETLNAFMRKRLNTVNEYLETITSFSSEEMKVLKLLSKSSNTDGKPFTATQKFEFIDLVYGYKENKIDLSVIRNAVKDGKIDINELHKVLLNKILKNIGFTDSEIASVPAEKMLGWDLKYIHLLAKSITDSEDETYHDLMRASMLDDFMRYIHDGSNSYGKANLRTKSIFEKRGWDYEAYIKPNKEHEVKLVIKDENSEQLAQAGEGFVNIIEQLMLPPLDKVIRKQLASYMKDGKFVIPDNVLKNKDNLYKFMTGVLKNLENVKKRAEGNLTNQEIDNVRRQSAKNTVTKFTDLQRITDNIGSMKTEGRNIVSDFNITIKMIDRNPQKDIFQGNYSTCCIGQGEFNDRAMAYYLMNTSSNMIELVDNESGRTIGNALCYFVDDRKGTPYFIIDNIEINNAYKGSREAGIKIRNGITEYASKVVKQITGKDDINICMSYKYNDVPISDLPSIERRVKFIGDVESKELYMDLFGGWESDFKGFCNLLFLK